MAEASDIVVCEKTTRVYQHSTQGEVRALDGVDLKIGAGEFVVVKGHSGSGKTTLLMALGCMSRPSGGRVLVEGRDPYALDGAGRSEFRANHIGFVFQMFHLIPYLTTLENVTLTPKGVAANDAQERAKELLGRFGLADRMGHRPAELSAGERQRAAIARAMINSPRLLLADEPTGNLDPKNSAEVVKLLRSFCDDGGTVMMVTHGDDADAYADRIIKMKAGNIIEDARPVGATV